MGAWGTPVACQGSTVCAGGICAGNLSLQYQCGNTGNTTQWISPHFQVTNTGTTSVMLSTISIRYFFTADGSAAQQFACNYAQIGCSNIVQKVYPWTPTTSTADHYLEVTFTGSGTIAAGANTGAMQLQFADTNYLNFTQTNDYSFNASASSYTNSANITVYQNNVLVWGTEP
jgi:hypothetical protein